MPPKSVPPGLDPRVRSGFGGTDMHGNKQRKRVEPFERLYAAVDMVIVFGLDARMRVL
ncbi:hypothetical protein SAMN02927914_00835 [Mesorhizobium qingshengii]|uniref:Uncharacterized protein n=1 Tax=Mesorhizobium qingshengii TaxID=1165689 RepID=A0A1G5VVH9_9HYPH|nr:hypothetical protein SAMN02927914_00835 [Mesorhizobium qingshengii]